MTSTKQIKHETGAPVGRPRGDSPSLPIYDSMSQCEGATGIPASIQKQAKAAGCDAFQTGSRVHLERLLRWLFRDDETGENVDWGNRLKRALALSKEIDLSKKQQLTADKGEVTVGLAKIQSTMFAALDRMRHEGPPDWKGHDEVTIYEKFGVRIDDLKSELSVAFERLEKGENESGTN